MDERKKNILDTLKKHNKLPTSRISGILGMNNNTTKKLLEELFNEKKINRHKETLATYWSKK